jgi:hypothetical protein
MSPAENCPARAAVNHEGASPSPRPWWLLGLPLGYLLHLADEWWGGEGFVAWIERATGETVSPTRFLVVNGIVWPVACALTVAAILRPRLAWFPVTFATVLLINATLHLLGTLYTSVYSPGLLTAVLFYLPFGVAALRHGHRRLPGGTFARALLAGVVVHGLVFVVAFA